MAGPGLARMLIGAVRRSTGAPVPVRAARMASARQRQADRHAMIRSGTPGTRPRHPAQFPPARCARGPSAAHTDDRFRDFGSGSDFGFGILGLGSPRPGSQDRVSRQGPPAAEDPALGPVRSRERFRATAYRRG